MATQTLIRMLKHQLDARQKDKILLLRQIEQTEQAVARLDQEMQIEKQQLFDQGLNYSEFLPYFERVNHRKSLLNESKQGLEHHLDALDGEVTALFSEMKKYEMLHAQSEAEISRHRLQEEQKQQDETTTSQYIRQYEEV